MLTEPAHSGMLKVEQMKFSKILNQLFFFFWPNEGEGGNVVRERRTLVRQEILGSFFFHPK